MGAQEVSWAGLLWSSIRLVFKGKGKGKGSWFDTVVGL
ncbi:hypothetical protein EV578_103590 [Streptomyces sp. BK205]|nr:hypothetical protein EV578_103590 [Streptomyces sp. BK205]